MRRRYSQTTAPGQPVYRGERRIIVPTPEIPDPSKADPGRLVTHLLTNRYGRSDPLWLRSHAGQQRPDESVGIHWSVDDRIIPQRFSEIYQGGQAGVQQGAPMSQDESRSIRVSDMLDNAEIRYRSMQERGRSPWDIQRTVTGRIDRTSDAIRDSNQIMYRDLSGIGQAGGRSPSEGAARPFIAQIIWEGRHNPAGIGERDELSTDFEREITYEDDTPMEITAAHVARIARPGEEFGNPSDKDIWNRVQFDQPIRSRISRSPGASTGIADRVIRNR